MGRVGRSHEEVTPEVQGTFRNKEQKPQTDLTFPMFQNVGNQVHVRMVWQRQETMLFSLYRVRGLRADFTYLQQRVNELKQN